MEGTRTVILEITYDTPVTFETLEILVDSQVGYEGVKTVKARLATEEYERSAE